MSFYIQKEIIMSEMHLLKGSFYKRGEKMLSAKTIYLTTDRLEIRAWTLSDLNDFYDYARVDGVGQKAGWLPHKSIDESKEILAKFIESDKELAIVHRNHQKAIGSVGIRPINYKKFPELKGKRGYELGYVLAKDYWGQGLMTEAVGAICDYLFSQNLVDFLLIVYRDVNIQSKRVAEKNSFSFYRKTKLPLPNSDQEVLATATIAYKKENA